jgi:hypothetical protein
MIRNNQRYHAFIAQSLGGGHRLFLSWDDPSGPRNEFGRIEVHVANGFTSTAYDEGVGFDFTDGIARADQLIQSILDEAWECGFRPAGFKDVKNETAAIRGHLEDMRALAFHKSGAAKP